MVQKVLKVVDLACLWSNAEGLPLKRYLANAAITTKIYDRTALYAQQTKNHK